MANTNIFIMLAITCALASLGCNGGAQLLTWYEIATNTTTTAIKVHFECKNDECHRWHFETTTFPTCTRSAHDRFFKHNILQVALIAGGTGSLVVFIILSYIVYKICKYDSPKCLSAERSMVVTAIATCGVTGGGIVYWIFSLESWYWCDQEACAYMKAHMGITTDCKSSFGLGFALGVISIVADILAAAFVITRHIIESCVGEKATIHASPEPDHQSPASPLPRTQSLRRDRSMRAEGSLNDSMRRSRSDLRRKKSRRVVVDSNETSVLRSPDEVQTGDANEPFAGIEMQASINIGAEHELTQDAALEDAENVELQATEEVCANHDFSERAADLDRREAEFLARVAAWEAERAAIKTTTVGIQACVNTNDEGVQADPSQNLVFLSDMKFDALPSEIKQLFRSLWFPRPKTVTVLDTLIASGQVAGEMDVIRALSQKLLDAQSLGLSHAFPVTLQDAKRFVLSTSLQKAVTEGTTSPERLLFRAMKTCGVPKTMLDILFPGFDALDGPSGAIDSYIRRVLRSNLHAEPDTFVSITEDLYESLVRCVGVIVTGTSLVGKTTSIRTLAEALCLRGDEGKALADDAHRPHFAQVQLATIFPGAYDSHAFFGHKSQGKWTPGILQQIIQGISTRSGSLRPWLLLDGTVDKVFQPLLSGASIKALSGEDLRWPQNGSVIFETESLNLADPSVVSNVAVVNYQKSHLQDGYAALLQHLDAIATRDVPKWATIGTLMTSRLSTLLPQVEQLLTDCTIAAAAHMPVHLARSVMLLTTTIVRERMQGDISGDLVDMIIVEAVTAVALGLTNDAASCERRLRVVFDKCMPTALKSVESASIASVFADSTGKWKSWRDEVTLSEYESVPFFDQVVHTSVSTRLSWYLSATICTQLNDTPLPVLIRGDPASGKSTCIKLFHSEQIIKVVLTSMPIHGEEYRNVLGERLIADGTMNLAPPKGKYLCVFVDDIALPSTNDGASNLELARQVMVQGGLYDRSTLGYKDVHDAQLAMAVPNSATLPARFQSRFLHLAVQAPSYDEICANAARSVFKAKGSPPNVLAAVGALMGNIAALQADISVQFRDRGAAHISKEVIFKAAAALASSSDAHTSLSCLSREASSCLTRLVGDAVAQSDRLWWSSFLKKTLQMPDAGNDLSSCTPLAFSERTMQEPRSHAIFVGAPFSRRRKTFLESSVSLKDKVLLFENLGADKSSFSIRSDFSKHLLSCINDKTHHAVYFSSDVTDAFPRFVLQLVSAAISTDYSLLQELVAPAVISPESAKSIRDLFHCFISVDKSNASLFTAYGPMAQWCSIHYFEQEDISIALLSAAKESVRKIDIDTPAIADKLPDLLVSAHRAAHERSRIFREESGLQLAVCRESFNVLLSTFSRKMRTVGDDISDDLSRSQLVLERLDEALQSVAEHRSNVEELRLMLTDKEKQEAHRKKLLSDLEAAQKIYDAVLGAYNESRSECSELERRQKECQDAVEEAKPALLKAEVALNMLSVRDIQEIRTFASPPKLVAKTMDAVLTLLEKKTGWPSAKTELLNLKFIEVLLNFDKDNIPPIVIKKLKKLIDDKDFTPEAVRKANVACESLCLWVIAMEKYHVVQKDIVPRRKRLAEAQDDLDVALEKIEPQKKKSDDALHKVQGIQRQLKDMEDSTSSIEEGLKEIDRKLNEAIKTEKIVSDERAYWAKLLDRAKKRQNESIGTAFLQSAALTYLGQFPPHVRDVLSGAWTKLCTSSTLPHDPLFSKLSGVVSIQNRAKLISDFNLPDVSAVSEVISLILETQSPCFALDPEGFLAGVLKKVHAGNVKCASAHSDTVCHAIEMAMQAGSVLIVEDCTSALPSPVYDLLMCERLPRLNDAPETPRQRTPRMANRQRRSPGDGYVIRLQDGRLLNVEGSFRLFFVSALNQGPLSDLIHMTCQVVDLSIHASVARQMVATIDAPTDPIHKASNAVESLHQRERDVISFLETPLTISNETLQKFEDITCARQAAADNEVLESNLLKQRDAALLSTKDDACSRVVLFNELCRNASRIDPSYHFSFKVSCLRILRQMEGVSSQRGKLFLERALHDTGKALHSHQRALFWALAGVSELLRTSRLSKNQFDDLLEVVKTPHPIDCELHHKIVKDDSSSLSTFEKLAVVLHAGSTEDISPIACALLRDAGVTMQFGVDVPKNVSVFVFRGSKASLSHQASDAKKQLVTVPLTESTEGAIKIISDAEKSGAWLFLENGVSRDDLHTITTAASAISEIGGSLFIEFPHDPRGEARPVLRHLCGFPQLVTDDTYNQDGSFEVLFDVRAWRTIRDV